MARMKALRCFTDASTGRLVAEGAEFDASEHAAAALARKGLAEPLDAPAPKPAPRPKRKAKSKR